jgi:hypothetical protein
LTILIVEARTIRMMSRIGTMMNNDQSIRATPS